MSRLALIAMSFVSAAPAALAEGYPSRPITVVVPYAAGGPADAIARVVTTHMDATLGRTFVIENVVGAGGTTGAARVAKQYPTGTRCSSTISGSRPLRRSTKRWRMTRVMPLRLLG